MRGKQATRVVRREMKLLAVSLRLPIRLGKYCSGEVWKFPNAGASLHRFFEAAIRQGTCVSFTFAYLIADDVGNLSLTTIE